MFSAMHYITFAEGIDKEATISAIQEAADKTSDVNLVAVPDEGGTNAGDVICKLGFADQDAFEEAKQGEGWAALHEILDDASTVAYYDYGAYDAGVTGIYDDGTAANCCHRVLMFADQENAKPEDVEALDQLCARFHEYVPMINWRVATIVESSGRQEWKHIWEQDFDSYETFVTKYMFTPFHPTYLDTYFDTECPNWTALPDLCTMTCTEPTAFLTNYAE
jgi:hypothetical protein